MSGRFLRICNPGEGLDLTWLNYEVVSAIVPQFDQFDSGTPVLTGYIAFCATSPVIEGVCAAAEFFAGDDSYGLACDFVLTQRQLYQLTLQQAIECSVLVKGRSDA